MPHYCSVPLCKNNSINNKDVCYYKSPAIWTRTTRLQKISELRLRRWMKAIKEEWYFETDPSPIIRICSKHFVSGKPANMMDCFNKDWVPTLHLGSKEKPQPTRETKKSSSKNDPAATIEGSIERVNKLTMEETFILILLVMVMLVGSYLAGSIPLVMKLSEEKLKIVTILGAGLLVGTALTVIIPEGIRSLYSSDIVPDKHILSKLFVASSEDTTHPSFVAAPAAGYLHHEEVDHSSTIGLSLVLGFVFMMLVDQISQRKSASNEQTITATLGLVVHAAADGVALGAAATTSHKDVEMIVFFAIMLHKAPAAFGLVSFLLHEKIERQKIRKHLAIFSLSAPLLTILTYFGIGQEQKETLNSVNATGIAMLFSAGTFLFVATVHVLPELTQGGHSHGGFDSSPAVTYTSLEDTSQNIIVSKRPKGLKNSELIIMIFGALLPLVITFEHHH